MATCVKAVRQFTLTRGTPCMVWIPLVKHACAPLILQQQLMKKHWTIKWRKERANKYYKVNLPDFDEVRERDKFTPDEKRIWMKKEGICQPRNFTRPMYISNTNSVFEPYVPPEGDGKASSLSKEGARERFTELKEKGKSYKELRKVRQYEDNFDTTSFAELANNIYIETHNLLQDVKKNENRLLELVTEKAYPEMTFGLDHKTLHWKFVESIEPARVVHIRTNPMITNDNIYAQITVRFHSKQVLALYDRFGRLMYGSEHLVKDVIDYVVFEKHIASLYGSWRIHGKIIPKWLPPREPLLKTYRKPNLNFEEIDNAEEKEKTDKKEEEEEKDEINEAIEKQKKKYNVEIV
ncbi:hypothetical protein CHS0354_033373 [Potamilus streckersoni]|uniref:Large ribosomal subunit protein mL45 n=1 Tax=Potamilus streckersoni TaxID=2493646 RepID=A0AAE0RTA3_9BIVA|nr:hypothetical protein CHS0354_033373 [Potamilus streckersoni]